MNRILPFMIVLIVGISCKVYGQSGSFDSDNHVFFEDGKNSNVQSSAGEAIDSATLDNPMKYYVLPSYKYNSGWYNADPALGVLSIKDPNSINGINSKFVYDVIDKQGGCASVDDPPANHTPDKKEPWVWLRWTHTGTATLQIQEVMPECQGKPSKLKIAVIAMPTFKFTVTQATACAEATATLNNVIAGKYEATSAVRGDRQIRLTYTVTGPDSPSGAIYANKTLAEFEAQAFTQPGQYTVVVTQVTDRISRKGRKTGADTYAAKGDVTNATFTFVKTPPVNTGPFYRVPNH